MCKKLFIFSFIFLFQNQYAELLENLNVTNRSGIPVKIKTFCNFGFKTYGTETIIQDNGEGVIGGQYNFFSCPKMINWSDISYIIFDFGSKIIGPIKVNKLLSDNKDDNITLLKKGNDFILKNN